MSQPRRRMPKIEKLLWLVFFSGVGLLAYTVVRALRGAAKPIAAGENAASYSIYIPSPVERAALQQMPKLWPETFHAQRPLTAAKLPLFYAKLFEDQQRHQLGLGAAQLALVRSWSMDANVASLDSLKRSLLLPVEDIFREVPPSDPVAEPKSFEEILKRSMSKGEAPCSLFVQERLFRIGQAWPQFQKTAATRYQQCVGPADLLAVWFDLNSLLFSDDVTKADPKLRDSVGARLTELHQKGSPVDSHLAERLSQAAFLKATH